jgi:uracil phosphoribosyltransferase
MLLVNGEWSGGGGASCYDFPRGPEPVRGTAMQPSPFKILDHPLLAYHVGRLRDVRTGPADFRHHLHAAGRALAHEAARDLPVRMENVTTPLEITSAPVWERPLVLVPILRAGLGLVHGFLDELPWARVGHLGMARNEETLAPEAYYARLPPDVGASDMWVLDPMLATGGSACAAVATLKAAGARWLRLCCLVAAPEGVARFRDAHPDVPVLAAALDRALDARAYILPGLGDAGDRYFGT